MDALDRMFHVLVRAARAKDPAFLTSSFTVGDVYQQILPYRHFRRELGLETNQEYELILMELLTGARGYLDVDERLRDQLGKELTSASPEPGRVRDFAESHAAINPAALAAMMQGSPPGNSAAARPSPISAALAGASAPSDSARCRYCNGDLPAGRTLHFCPHCGQNLQVLNCAACGAEVEADWRYCVACGKAVA